MRYKRHSNPRLSKRYAKDKPSRRLLGRFSDCQEKVYNFIRGDFMKKILTLSILLILALPMSISASTPSVIKQTPTHEKIPFEEIIKIVDDKMKDQVIQVQEQTRQFKLQKETQHNLSNDLITPMGNVTEIDSWTMYLNDGNFDGVGVYNYTLADMGLLKTTWDYTASGNTISRFDDGQVTHTFQVFGVSTTWPPVTQTYSHSSNWVQNKTSVSISGSDYSMGYWIAGFASVEFIAAKNNDYYSYSW